MKIWACSLFVKLIFYDKLAGRLEREKIFLLLHGCEKYINNMAFADDGSFYDIYYDGTLGR